MTERCCGTCKHWENTYLHSRIVTHSMGSCNKQVNVDMSKLPEAFTRSWTGWFAMDKTDGTQCPTWKGKP